jgi:hypothetical protein
MAMKFAKPPDLIDAPAGSQFVNMAGCLIEVLDVYYVPDGTLGEWPVAVHYRENATLWSCSFDTLTYILRHYLYVRYA